MAVEIEVGGTKYKYNEERTGSRGITLWRSGVAQDQHSYKFNPDPHDERWYNNNQPRFYREAAIAIATVRNNNNAYPPDDGTVSITIHNTSYTLDAF
jgi:hypothetical protein